MITIRKFLVFAIVAGFMASCNPAKFDRLPGEKMEIIPIGIQGTYEVNLNMMESATRDSFFININDNSIKQITRLGIEENKINEQFYFNRLNNFYLIGTPDANIKSLWNITVLEPVANGLRVYYVLEEKTKNSQPSRMMPYLSDREMPLNHEPIIAMPDPKGGMTTPPLGNGDSNSTLKYMMMNDEQFANYFDRELRGKEFILLKKVKTNDKKSKKK
ncbi:MAG: hypothetical protein Q8M15_15235 [Bacteroidota bacterium]|nr:hypothetical protein [Bacteroidota bacterium]